MKEAHVHSFMADDVTSCAQYDREVYGSNPQIFAHILQKVISCVHDNELPVVYEACISLRWLVGRGMNGVKSDVSIAEYIR